MRKNRLIPLLLYLLMLVLLFSWTSDLFDSSMNNIPYSQVIQLFQAEQVKNFTVDDQTISLENYVLNITATSAS